MIELQRSEKGVTPPKQADFSRIAVRGKFLFEGERKYFVRGATYGTFAYEDGASAHVDPSVLQRDFAAMAANGFNTLRTYTVPDGRVLDAAERNGLHVMVGLPWEQHIAFLDERRVPRRIEEQVRRAVRRCGGHPAVLCYAAGNEIPASIVRWLGRHRVERFIERLCRAVKDEDPCGLVTYVNYPTTEYLELPFLDLVCFNVYLENQHALEAYVSRLQNVAGDRPLLMGEVGLDSNRHGEAAQARAIDWQLRSIFHAGCAGAFAFAWTDEWHRGGHAIEDWDFGLVRRDRTPKPALAAARDAFAQAPFGAGILWPPVSVVVCAYNARRTIAECLRMLRAVDYPDFETIVVDDGSTDGTGEIARAHGVRVIRTENRGLSSARNTGMAAARGEIVAYLDSDAYPDTHWLKYLAYTFMTTPYVGVGGPNLAPPGHRGITAGFDRAPGGPVAVLLSDREAEHIPGCNMAFRKSALAAIGGFDPQLRIAGDDVDVCWRLQQRGWSLGFAPGAVVWHHRRTTLRSYWRQQRGYGRAEALLERKWPEKYNALGHLTWAGRIYAQGVRGVFAVQRVYAGTWGTAPYQSIERGSPNIASSLALLPESYLVVAALAALAGLGFVWHPLFLAVPLLAIAVALPLTHAVLAARAAIASMNERSASDRIYVQALVAFLYLLHPLARLYGRIENGLTCWRGRPPATLALAAPRRYRLWSESARAGSDWLEALEGALRREHALARRGGPYDRWDLHVRGGALGSARVLIALEEHGAGKQLLRLRSWPRCSASGIVLISLTLALAIGALADHAWVVCAIMAGAGVATGLRAAGQCAAATASVQAALEGLEGFSF